VYLKNKFGVGYNLTIVKENTNVPSPPIMEVVMKAIPSAIILSNVSAEVAF
jgi:ATP-binding cassette subfamily A (ABC1) protein 3